MSTKKAIGQLEKLLDAAPLEESIKALERITGKSKGIDQMMLENENIIATKLKQLGLKPNVKGEDVYLALFNIVEKMNDGVYHALGDPDYATEEGLMAVMGKAFDEVNHDKGFFIKEEKAREMLRKIPPKNLVGYTKYKSIEEVLEKESVKEVMSIMRFSEKGAWMHQFLQQYQDLVPDDFEKRSIELIVLDPKKWYEAARGFIKKKRHNMSHLKEMGVIFGMPEKAQPLGQALKIFSLTCHYYFEVKLYSNFFSSVPVNALGENLIKVLQADIYDPPTRMQKDPFWRIIQRYILKDIEPDARIFEPHLSSEVLHWRLAMDRFIELDSVFPGLNIEFWDGLDHVGNFFPSKHNGEILVNFNLADNILSCCEFLPASKSYFYHFKEDMWNSIFDMYFSEPLTRTIIFQFLSRGYITESDLGTMIR